MQKFTNIFLLIILLVIQIHAQDKTDAMLFGDVKSATTKEHIPYANILVKGTKLGTSADASGHFKLANLPLGKLTIIAQAVGYKPQEKEVVMQKNKAVDIFFELETDILNLGQVVVTGTRTEHFIKDVPVRTEVITMKEIDDKNASNLYEALEGTPGVIVEQQCQYCNFSMVRMQGLGAEHTQILIDGQPIYSGLAGVYGLQQIGTVDINQIEVVKGAGSALYGSSAVAGSINIVTKEPSFTPSTNIDIQLGSYNTNRYSFSSSIRNDEGNLGLNIFAEKLVEDAIDLTGPGLTINEVKNKDGISDRVSSDLTNAGIGLFIDNALFEEDKLIIKGKLINENRRGGILTDDYFKNPFTDFTESIYTKRYETQLNYKKNLGATSGIDFSIAYANHNREATNDTYLSDYMLTHNDSTPNVLDMRPYIAKENSLTSTLTFNTTIGNHNLLFGLQSFYDKLEETGMYVVVDNASNYLGQSYKSIANKSAQEFGAFLQDEWSLIDKLMIVPGVRIDKHHSEEVYNADRKVFDNYFPVSSFDETSINPRLAIKYDASDYVVIRANIGTGFRAPYGFSEDLHLCSGSPRVWKSSELKPETAISYNLSSDYYGENFRVSANLFHTDLKNKIGFSDAEKNIKALGYDYQWKNIDDAFVQGIELYAQINLTNNFNVGASFTFNQGQYKNPRLDWIGTEYESVSKYIPRFPSTTGNLKIEYNPQEWNLSLVGNFQGNMYIDYYSEDPRFASKIKKTNPFMIFNARVSKKINDFKIYAGVDNIFNYIQDERHLDDAAFMYAPVYGTMFYGGASVEIKY
ncbi:Outer membrane ferrienterochelin/colicins receptor [Ignavibacterium album JCM 16511]|uniref:Outer membrane ferrienterochelin/colicins receptor n=1 Tax=Ignavibacterium album (strain DSM 19864 / JCM 16511 / NBRC 101810 / Mat9-16) TaxID=945713 RepID=I0AIM5_IGNAJ|nr:TonB-dependent receptor [Ignavibacterium album]AFH48832.1 Outer membrane ferrienterochelin/colicins receptor [Ignavibacterium album JCM 16511]